MSVEKFDPIVVHDKCGTPECCQQCDNPRDWYLVGINPWSKILFNPVTGERKVVKTDERL